MSYVPSESLSKLLCVNCQKCLSAFPVYFHPKQGSVCGRCPQPAGQNVARNEIYETIAQAHKFPCCYYSNGCTVNMVPSKLSKHEKFCPYMKYDCPTFASTNCEWRGSFKDLLDHFEEKHLTFYLKDAQFEVDFINSYRENCLLPYGENLFIVNRSNDSRTKTFSFTIEYVGTDSYVENSTYKIILENETKSHAHVITNKLNVRTDINVGNVNTILNNPSSIIATIEILEHEDTINIEEAGDDCGNNDLNYDLLKELECTVCFEHMFPPIHQCVTGHSICLKCKNSVDKCPTCQAKFENTQNFTLAQVINFITYPCKNKRCKFTAKAKDIKKHEASCIYGPVSCPLREYEDCLDDIILSEMYDHISKWHYENLLEMETVSQPFDSGEDQDDEDCYILKYASRLFKLHYRYREGEFSWAMQLIGPPEECEKYMFEIDIVDNSGKHRRAYFKAVCSPLSNSDSAFDNDKSIIFIDYKQIQSMITKDFTYRVRISQD